MTDLYRIYVRVGRGRWKETRAVGTAAVIAAAWVGSTNDGKLDLDPLVIAHELEQGAAFERDDRHGCTILAVGDSSPNRPAVTR